MEMTSSTIFDLQPICRCRDLSLGTNDGVRRLKLSRYGPSDLALPNRSRIFSHGCCKDVCPCNICPDCYVLDNGDSYSRLSNDVDQAARFLFPGILVLVLLPMMVDYFNGCVCARSLGIAAQKNYGRTFVGIFRFMVLYLSSNASRKVQHYVMKEERV
jgi:hypothetical protein